MNSTHVTTQSIDKQAPGFVDPDDSNMVSLWIRKDPTRWMAGVFAGALAGVMALVVAMIMSKIGGMELFFPAKLMATPVLGSAATELQAGASSIIVGFIVWEAIAIFWGVIYSHFVITNVLSGLLSMGLVWAAFLWIFNWNLYFQSWSSVRWAGISPGVVFPICLVYGLALSSVAFFDRTVRS